MQAGQLLDLDLNIARARLVLSVTTVLSIWFDPTVPDLTPWFRLGGGWMAIDRYALSLLLAHFVYSAGLHAAAALGWNGRRYVLVAAAGDVFFGISLAVFTEGATSPSYAFLSFAILAVGCREGFRMTFLVTAVSTLLYLGLIVVSADAEMHDYLMRPIYFAVTGFLIGFLGQQRLNFEARVRQLERQEQRQEIARSLHDGYVQALAAVNLRLETCRRMIGGGRVEPGLRELSDLRDGVAREYDQLRSYVRSLVDLDDGRLAQLRTADTAFDVGIEFRAPGVVTEQVLQILLEAVRNTVRHASAATCRVRARQEDGTLRIVVEDDGVGLAPEVAPPWSIASRVGHLGGAVRIGESREGARLEIDLPAEVPA